MRMFKHWTQINSWNWCSRFGEQWAACLRGDILCHLYVCWIYHENDLFSSYLFYILRSGFSVFLLVALFALVHLFDCVPHIVNGSIRIWIFGHRFYPFNYSIPFFSIFLLKISSALFHVARTMYVCVYNLLIFRNKTDKYFLPLDFISLPVLLAIAKFI